MSVGTAVRGLRLQAIFAAIVCALAMLFAAPNFFDQRTLSAWPNWLPSRQLPLGIEFVGGASLLLSPNTGWLEDHALRDMQQRVRGELRQNRIKYEELRFIQNGIAARLTDPAQLERAAQILARTVREWDWAEVGEPPGFSVQVQPDGLFQIRTTETLRRSLKERVLRREAVLLRCQGWLKAAREGEFLRFVIPAFPPDFHRYRPRC
jgi:preprotein translocase subunit SecD